MHADQYPRLDVNAGASRGTFSGTARSRTTDSNTFVAAPLYWEVDFWGKFRRATESALTAFREVEEALAEIDTYRAQILAVERQQKAAANANRLSGARYDKGITSYLEVLETERALFDVGLQLSELQREYLNAYVNLYKALGGGWVTHEEMEAGLAAGGNPADLLTVKTGGLYRVRVQGRPSGESLKELDDLTVTEESAEGRPPVTTLEGTLPDQAALTRLLQMLAEQNLPLLSVARLE